VKIELTIETTYLPSWGIWEGLRELYQNGVDAEREFHAPLKVTWRNGTLRFENEGVTLPHESLLLGRTSKADRDDLIGQFGEGLKLGLLALVRAGRAVCIRSGSEVWTPAIERSQKFDADVLVVDIARGRKPRNRVCAEVRGVEKEEWENIRDRFLDLARIKKDERVETYDGDLLLGERFRGQVYVKGIFVQTDGDLAYGYNYRDAKLDRDRKMVDTWDKRYRNARIWKHAAAKRPDLFDSFYDLLEQGATDTEGVEGYAAQSMEPELVAQVAARFTERFGEQAVPVATLEESKDIEHLGRRGVVASKPLKAVVEQKVGSLFLVQKELREEVLHTYSWGDLTAEEKTNLEDAIALIDEPDVLSKADVVDFRDEKLQGQWKDGRYLIARGQLADRDETLCTLVHEVAHEVGADGEKSHVARIEALWTRIVGKLRDKVEGAGA